LKKVGILQSLATIKILADTHRLEIMRLLMGRPASLTDLARTLGRSPAWVRHHLLALETAGLVEMSEIRKTGRITEKIYRAEADVLLLQEIVLPNTSRPTVIFSGSHDLAMEGIAEHLQKHILLLNLPVGSLDGLINLRLGLCQVAGSHLLDESGEYNTPFIRHLFPDRVVDVITLAHRTQGLVIAPENPKRINELGDLTRPGIRFVNRNTGSGTRLWLDGELRRNGLPPEKINGYDTVVQTHSEAAIRIQTGKADAALGLQAAAYRHGLDFIPLFEERYDLVLSPEQVRPLSPLLDYIQTNHFRKSLTALTGYDTTHSGEQIPV
jgi:putative molybdopterin biosynthesis protein